MKFIHRVKEECVCVCVHARMRVRAPAQNILFENKIDWHLVCKDDAYSLC